MTLPNRIGKPNIAPALFRLLSDSSLSRAALSACGLPVAMLDAAAASHPVTYVNPAFAGFFGFRESEALGRSLAALIFRGDEGLVQGLLSESAAPRELKAWAKDGAARHVELTLGAIRSVEGRHTHWVIAFSDRAEVERLRAELKALKAPARAA
jgi:PAS domain S-box-containing protein